LLIGYMLAKALHRTGKCLAQLLDLYAERNLFCAWNARASTSIRSSEMLCTQSPGSNTPSVGGGGCITH
jgi:hypothetical protein